MTTIKPVRTENDYREALAEMKQLWGSKSGTPEGDRLDVLATLVDAYENQHHPLDPPDPIEAITFRMEQQGPTRKDLQPSLQTNGASSVGLLVASKASMPPAEPPELELPPTPGPVGSPARTVAQPGAALLRWRA
ncbi:MAG: helix-turn-helix domain-containing protein [Deltaproteobacteria bacterium]